MNFTANQMPGIQLLFVRFFHRSRANSWLKKWTIKLQNIPNLLVVYIISFFSTFLICQFSCNPLCGVLPYFSVSLFVSFSSGACVTTLTPSARVKLGVCWRTRLAVLTTVPWVSSLTQSHAELAVTADAVIFAAPKQSYIVRQLASKICHPLVFARFLVYLWSCNCLISEVGRSVTLCPPDRCLLNAIENISLVRLVKSVLCFSALGIVALQVRYSWVKLHSCSVRLDSRQLRVRRSRVENFSAL